MNMNIRFLEHFWLNPQHLALAARITEGSMGTFLHHITQFAREFEIAFAGHKIDFDEENITTSGRPGHSCRYPNLIHLRQLFLPKTRWA
jgi:hypothetical protein